MENLIFIRIQTDIPEFKPSYCGYFVLDKNNDFYLGLTDKWKKIMSVDDIEDTVTGESKDKALSVYQGKLLDEKIVDLSDRLTELENAPSNSPNVKKDTLKFYHQLGEANADLKPYADALRESMLGMEDFAKLGTGLFIHWGVYSVPAGTYTGTKQTGSTVTATTITRNAEWIMRDLAIPVDTYKAYQSQFNTTNWDADNIAKMASEAGMGYIVITLKHHEGFSLYPTNYGYWDVKTAGTDDAPCRLTLVDELKEACDKYHLKFGVYISQYADWCAEGGFNLTTNKNWNGSSTDLYTDTQHMQYLERTHNQMLEIIEKYDPYIIWWDPVAAYSAKYQNYMVNSWIDNYPHIITNDRITYDRAYGDFGTGERTIYLKNKLKYGEACFTMNNTWGYCELNEKDSAYYSKEKIFKEFIIYSLAYGQNCLMNIGPKADGSIPERQVTCLTAIKNFSDTYGSFKNYTRVNKTSMPKFGYTLKLEGNKLLCYVVTSGNPANQNVFIDGIDLNNISSVDILTPGTNASYEIQEDGIQINNLGLDSDTKIGIVRINYSQTPYIYDANFCKCNEVIPSRVFPMVNGASWSFTTLAYSLKPSAKINHSTEFIWNDNTDSYNIELVCDILDNAPVSTDEVTTITVTDLEANTSTVITLNHLEFTSETNISLVNGKRYKLEIKCSGTNSRDTYRLTGFKFVNKAIHVQSITLNETTILVEEEGTNQLIATVSPEDATNKNVIWTSANESIATVEDGLVVGMTAGETTVSATTEDGSLIATCTVIVTAASSEDIIQINNITLDKTSETITIGQTSQLTASFDPTNATYQNVRWESNDTTKATVEDGLVTATGIGTVTIKCTSQYDSTKYATCIFTITGIQVSSVEFDNSTLTLIPGYSTQLISTISPADATDKTLNWSSTDSTIASVDNEGNISAKSAGTVTITATSTNNKVATCTVTVSEETYDYLFEATRMDATIDQGEDTGLKIFSDEMTNWTLFGYVHDNINAYRPGTISTYDSNQTLYQCVVNSSPWTGVRVDANSNVSKVIDTHVPERFRFMAGTDNYVNATTGALMGSSIVEDAAADKHPICFSRNDNVYKFSTDGKNWTAFEGLNATQLARLKDCILTVGFDYTRSNGAITTTKYRFLKTEKPCCVAFKTITDYPFYTLYHKYDASMKVTCADLIIDEDILTNGISLHSGNTYQLEVTPNPRHCTSPIIYMSSDENNATVSSNGLISYVSTGTATITVVCDTVIKVINVTCEADVPTYEVTTNLTGVDIEPVTVELQKGDTYTATLSVSDPDNTIMNDITIMMGTVDVTETSYDYETGIITIENVTDVITITANATDKHTVDFQSDIQMTIDGVACSSTQPISIDSIDKINWLNSITNE